jgi:hypothetical protein
MKPRFFIILMCSVLAACSRLSPIARLPQVIIALDGKVNCCLINAGDTVTTALNKLPAQDTEKPMTVVLVRRGPEGIVHERLDCDRDLRLMDWREDKSLRDGDQLIVPVAAGPSGLSRPSAPGIPVSE